MNTQLNSQQRKLVEDNHRLIFGYMTKKGLSTDDAEDWYGVCALGLMKAAMGYDPSRHAQFSTYAYMCMENEVKNTWRFNNTHHKPTYSIDDMSRGNARNLATINLIEDPHDHVLGIHLKDAIEQSMAGFSDRDKQIILRIICDGQTHRVVAKEFNLSAQRVGHIHRRFTEAFKTYWDGE